jgi:hypothetical protein
MMAPNRCIDWGNSQCLRGALALLLGMAVLPWISPHGAHAADGGSELQFLHDQIANAQSDEERFYAEQTLLLVQADQAKDKDAIAAVRDNLVQFGQENKQDIFGARALTLAGDIESIYLHNASEGRELYDEAFALFTAQAYHDSGDLYLPYVGERRGYTYLADGDPAGAIEAWKEIYFMFPRKDMALHLPGLISQVYRDHFPGKEGWQATMDFYDEALEAIGDVPNRGRLVADRLTVMNLGAVEFYIPADDYIDEVTAMLEAYPPGENEFFDINRDSFANSVKQFAENYPTRAKKLEQQAKLAASEARDAMNAPPPTDQPTVTDDPDTMIVQRAETQVQAPQREQTPGVKSPSITGWITLAAIGALLLLGLVALYQVKRKSAA